MSQLRIGFVGTGGFSKMHAQKLAKVADVRIAAFTATSQAKADAAAADYTDAKGYDNVLHMIDSQKLDAVYVCVPPFAHGEIERVLVDREIPFLVEKPLAATAELPEEIAAAVAAKKLITSVGYHFRYMDATEQMRQLLQERTVGMALGYFMSSMPGVSWWRSQEGSGGQFVEQTTHIVDLLRYTLGEVNEVYAAYGDRIKKHQTEDVTVADVGTVTLKLASGAVATISNTCVLPFGGPVGLHVYTDQGILELHGDRLVDREAARLTEYRNQNNPYDLENDAFLHALRTGDESRIRSTYADSLLTHRITTAANQSALSGLPVKLS